MRSAGFGRISLMSRKSRTSCLTPCSQNPAIFSVSELTSPVESQSEMVTVGADWLFNFRLLSADFARPNCDSKFFMCFFMLFLLCCASYTVAMNVVEPL